MIHNVALELASGKLTLETGRLAREAGGSVIVRMGDTMVLATATASLAPRDNIDFFPLLVDFEEKLYAVGKIPGGFFKREGRPTEKAILTARLIDRPIRPLFPKGYINDVQIVITPLSVDEHHSPDVLAMIGSSAALGVAGLPMAELTGSVRVGKVNGEYLVNPTVSQMKESSMDLLVSGTKDLILMLEAGAQEVSEAEVIEGIRFGQGYIKKIIELQEELVSKAKISKQAVEIATGNEGLKKFLSDRYLKEIKANLAIPDKSERYRKGAQLLAQIEKEILSSNDEALQTILAEKPKDLSNIISKLEKESMREMIIKEGKRLDGRGITDIRPISCDIGILPRTHGSGLFTRGNTQVLSVATLGAIGEVQRIDGLDQEETTKRYMHHYNFPAYSVGEVRPLRGPGRREIGHGALAERAVLPVVPAEDKFPYAIRVVSEVLMSNGSTSMASTCGSILALMDAGVPISNPVAGVSVGLIKEGNESRILTDIQGIEDHYGDMDFKITGTRKGITAIQLDLKLQGVELEILEKAMQQSLSGRLYILDKIQEVIEKPKTEVSPYAPSVLSVKVNPEKIGIIIGPGGKMIRKITEETGANIDIEDDGQVFITATDRAGGELAKKKIEELTHEVKVGEEYMGKVARILNFGAFVEILPGKEGLVHISQIENRRIAKVEDVLNVGDEVKVKVIEIDDQGRINLSRKVLLKDE